MPIAWLPAAGAWSLFLWVLLALSTSGLPSPDLWWQLAGGRAVMAGAFPWTDTFSFTAYGLPWLNHEWLAEVGMYVAFQAGGLTLIHVVRIALLGLAFVTAAGVALVEGRRQWCAALAACLALANAEPSSFFDARPYLATYLGLPLVWLLVEWALRRDSIRPLYLLPPVFLVWANCHSGFVAGLGLLGVLTVVAPHEKRRHLALALVASVLTGLASPF
ncbi:MAG: hypothetical protein FJX76_16830, partial [Armatimonadetes bacterium]|nr:hypothetical protein [Armatimonadota bacterium]